MGGVEVLKVGGASNKLPVDDHGKANVQNDVIVDGQSEEDAY